MWDVAKHVLEIGGDVVLDYGCWARVERDDYRNRAKELGVDFKLHYMDVPYSEYIDVWKNEIETSLKARLKFPKRKWIDTSRISNRRPRTSLYEVSPDVQNVGALRYAVKARRRSRRISANES